MSTFRNIPRLVARFRIPVPGPSLMTRPSGFPEAHKAHFLQRSCLISPLSTQQSPPDAYRPNHHSNAPRSPRPIYTHRSPYSLTPSHPSRADYELRQRETRRLYLLTLGALTGMISLWLVATSIDPNSTTDRADAPHESRECFTHAVSKGVEVLLGDEPGDETHAFGPGAFPRRVKIGPIPPSAALQNDTEEEAEQGEYVLLGHGARTVSFLRIQVYVVGIYVHTDDLPSVSSSLHAVMSSTPQGARADLTTPEALSATLLAPGVRSLVRIVPTRSTDWAHLRDGWVRGIVSRLPMITSSGTTTGALAAPAPACGEEGDVAPHINAFKTLFQPTTNPAGRSIPKENVIILLRGQQGGLTVLYDPVKSEKEKGVMKVGKVQDERISRALWLCYLSGGSVASEEMRGRVVTRLERLVAGWGRGEKEIQRARDCKYKL
ncbi:chalcone-flavanone isomerase-domain-containing protein [Kalaharituber pfeilii]|nr:chalcone-flavanone isomerase-domain-containing protein [Kalaharituber pfeilii]